MAYYSDININLEKTTGGDIKEETNIEAIKNAISNILDTMQGDRRMLPEFALNVYQLLFDPIDDITANDIGQRILETIQIWDDRVIVEEISIYPRYDYNRYDIQLTFRIQGFKETEEISYILRRV